MQRKYENISKLIPITCRPDPSLILKSPGVKTTAEIRFDALTLLSPAATRILTRLCGIGTQLVSSAQTVLNGLISAKN